LIRTARELFLREGYFATSIDRVADAAGYSKGAVYSNFASKDELCLAVLDRLLAERARELAAAWRDAAGDIDARLAALGRWINSVTADQGWITLEVEFASQVRTDPRLRRAFADRARNLRSTLSAVIEAAAEAGQVELVAPPEQLAAAVVALVLGVALQRAVDPELAVQPLVDAAHRVAGATIRAGTLTVGEPDPTPA
jgi:AcrR family transcriptional regulator